MKNKCPLVTVILPNFNGAKFLSRSILSITNQSYRNIELIIVDDCSTDSSLEIIKNFSKRDKRIRYFKTKKNSGTVGLPRNLGISKAKGSYVAFLDSDDYWNLNKLEYQMFRIKNYKFSFTAAYYEKYETKQKSNFIFNLFRIILQIFFITRIVKAGKNYWLYLYNPFLISSVIIKKKAIKNFRFVIDPYYREDLIFWLEVFSKYKQSVIFHPKILLTITRVENSMSSDKILEFYRIINSISNFFLKTNNNSKFNYFIFGILLRSLKFSILYIYLKFKKNIFIFFYLIIFFYFIIYYSPLSSILGRNLIFYNTQKKTDAVFVFSGHQGFDYVNNSYIERYYDIRDYLEKYEGFEDTKFFLTGKLSFIPEQKILESLLLNDNVKKDNIKIIFKEYESTYVALKLFHEILLQDNTISSITFITSPYHSLRVKKIWDKVAGNKYDAVFFKNVNLPKKNKFFERSFNKREILYEILANYHNEYYYKK